MGRNVGTGKVAYSWISPNSVKTGPTLASVVVVIIVVGCKLTYPMSLYKILACAYW